MNISYAALSMTQELGRPISTAEVEPIVAQKFAEVFEQPLAEPLPPLLLLLHAPRATATPAAVANARARVRRDEARAAFMSYLHWCDNVVRCMYSGVLRSRQRL